MGKLAKLKKARVDSKTALLTLYQKVSSQVLPRHFRPDCCLNGTRICIEVMEHFGIPAKPMACEVVVFNKAWWDRLVAAKGEAPKTKEELMEWTSGPDRAWALGSTGSGQRVALLEKGSLGGGYDWHLVTLAYGHVIDSASGQFRRSSRNIEIPPVVVLGYRADFVTGKKPIVAQNNAGTVFSYKAHPEIKDFWNISGFSRSEWNLEAAREIIHVMTKMMVGDERT